MLKTMHPLTLFVYFFFVIFTAVFTFNPLYLSSSMLCSVMLLFMLNGSKSVKTAAIYLVLIIIISITNPLFSHNGATALLFINDNCVTLEAFIYGICASLMIVSMLAWFNCFNKVFDSEKLMYLLGRFFPKLALVFSMTLHFIPRLIREFKSINAAQKSLSRGRLKRYLSAFSAVITRSMEGAIITSDSMNARGYTLKGRSFFHRFRFTLFDAVYLAVFSALFALSLLWRCEISYYPYFAIKLNTLSLISVISYFILTALPIFLEAMEAIRWKLSMLRI